MAAKALNHTYRHFADLQLSSRDFYQTLAKAVKSREFPEVDIFVKEMSTGGFFSVKREYLCISYHRYRYYVCAAPFGRSYFITWWFQYESSTLREWVYRSPILSYLFEEKATTMFRKDTQLMFQSSVNEIITEVSAGVQPQHGLRVAAPMMARQLS